MKRVTLSGSRFGQEPKKTLQRCLQRQSDFFKKRRRSTQVAPERCLFQQRRGKLYKLRKTRGYLLCGTGQEIASVRSGGSALPIEPTPDSARQYQHLEVFHALDNLCFTDDSLATRHGFVIHVGRLHPHPADIGHCDGIDTHYSRTKSDLARAVRMWSIFFEEVSC